MTKQTGVAISKIKHLKSVMGRLKKKIKNYFYKMKLQRVYNYKRYQTIMKLNKSKFLKPLKRNENKIFILNENSIIERRYLGFKNNNFYNTHPFNLRSNDHVKL